MNLVPEVKKMVSVVKNVETKQQRDFEATGSAWEFKTDKTHGVSLILQAGMEFRDEEGNLILQTGDKGTKLVCFENKNKKTEKHPDMTIYISTDDEKAVIQEKKQKK